VGPNFRWIANGPGYGAGTWEEPRGQYGVAQLSTWLLFPLTAYKKAALWDDVQRWFDGGAPSTGLIKTEASAVHTCGKGGGSSWSI
jgi:hypothetical protein